MTSPAADGGRKVISASRNDTKMPNFCAVYGCAKQSNWEKNKSYFQVSKVVTHKSDQFKKTQLCHALYAP